MYYKSLGFLLIGLAGIAIAGVLLLQNQDLRQRAASGSFEYNEQLIALRSKYSRQVRKAGGKLDSPEVLVTVSEMEQVASQRKDTLLLEAKSDLPVFFQHAILSDQRESFPENIQPYIEYESTKEGKITNTFFDDFDNNQSFQELNIVDTEFVSTRIFSESLTLDQVSGASISATGLQIGDNIMVQSDDYSLGKSPISPISPDNPLGNNQPVLVLLVNFQADQSRPVTVGEVQSKLDTEVAPFADENSYGNITHTFDVFGWYTINDAPGDCDFENWWQLARSAAAGDVGDINSYRHIVYGFPASGNCQFNAFTQAGFPSNTYLQDPVLQQGHIYAHELGHNYHAGGTLIAHASHMDCGAGVVGIIGAGCNYIDYGDLYDVMGKQNIFHFNAPHQSINDWISGELVTNSGQRTVYSLSSYNSPKFLKIYKPDTGEYYYLSQRAAQGNDSSLPQDFRDGISIHLWTGSSGDPTLLLDTNPETGTLDDAPLTSGQTFIDSVNNITIKNLSHTSTETVVDIQGATIPNSGTYWSCDTSTWECEANASGGFQNKNTCLALCDQNGGNASCLPWKVYCNDGTPFTESSCSTQQQFNATWPGYPGGGFGRWSEEACASRGGVAPDGPRCPNEQAPPIGGCVTINCPNGDTYPAPNGDGRCTIEDQGANTQGAWNGTACPIPDSGCGDINIYQAPFTPQNANDNWHLYCGNIYSQLDCDIPEYRFTVALKDTAGGYFADPSANCTNANSTNLATTISCDTEGCNELSWVCQANPHFDIEGWATTNTVEVSIPTGYRCQSWEIKDANGVVIGGASGTCEVTTGLPGTGDFQRRLELTIAQDKVWNMQAQAMCDNGYIPPNYQTTMEYGFSTSTTAPNWQSATANPTSHIASATMTSTNNSEAGYVRMRDSAGNYLQPVSAWDQSYYTFSQTLFSAPNNKWTAKFTRNLPGQNGNNAYVKFRPPASLCSGCSTVTLTGPANNSVLNQSNASVGWNVCAGAPGYRVNITGPNVNRTTSFITTNSFNFGSYMSTATPGGKYQVKVRACRDGVYCEDATEWSTPRSFYWITTPSPTPIPPTATPTPTNAPIPTGVILVE